MKKTLILLLLFSLMSGIAAAEPLFALRTENVYVSFSELRGDTVYNLSSGVLCAYGGITYRFSGEINPDTQNDIIERTENAMKTIETVSGLKRREGMSITVTDSHFAPLCEQGTLYVGVSETGDTRYVAQLARLMLGDKVNYGLLWALGDRAATILSWPRDERASLEEAFALSDAEWPLLDLNEACFMEEYAGTSLPKVREIAYALFTLAGSAGRESLLTTADPEELNTLRNRLLATHGLPEYDEGAMARVTVRTGGEKYLLRFATAEGTCYIEREFAENNIGNPFGGSYQLLRGYIAELTENMQRVSEKLGTYRLLPAASAGIFFTNKHLMYTEENKTYAGTDGGFTADASLALPLYVHLISRDLLTEPFVLQALPVVYGFTDDTMKEQAKAFAAAHPEIAAGSEGMEGSLVSAAFYLHLCDTIGEETTLSACIHNNPLLELRTTWADLLTAWDAERAQ